MKSMFSKTVPRVEVSFENAGSRLHVDGQNPANAFGYNDTPNLYACSVRNVIVFHRQEKTIQIHFMWTRIFLKTDKLISVFLKYLDTCGHFKTKNSRHFSSFLYDLRLLVAFKAPPIFRRKLLRKSCEAIVRQKKQGWFYSREYIYFYQYFGRQGLPSSGSSYNEEVNNLTLQFEN